MTLYYEDVETGQHIPPLRKRPSAVQLFRYSAITWNAHRIHYDKPYAAEEGYPDVLVQAHLHGGFLMQMLMDWIGPRGRVARFAWQNRRFAVPGDELTCSGVVTRKYVEHGLGHLECALEERNQRGELCVPGEARVVLPLAAGERS